MDQQNQSGPPDPQDQQKRERERQEELRDTLKGVAIILSFLIFAVYFPLLAVTLVIAKIVILALVTAIAITASAEKKDENKKYIKRPWQATKIPTGNTVLTVKGDSVWHIWPNIGGYGMSREEDLDGRHWLVKIPAPPDMKEKKVRERTVRKEVERRFFHGTFFAGRFWKARTLPWYIIGGWYYLWLWRKLGRRIVSFIYPLRRIHIFDIRSRVRLVDEHRITPDSPLRDMIEESDEDTEVHSLLYLVPRPILVEGVELGGDNSRINILLLVFFYQVIPSLPIFILKADFFNQLDSAVKAAIVNLGASHRVAVNEKGNLVNHTYDPRKSADHLTQHPDESDEDFQARKSQASKSYKPAPLTLSHWLQIDRSNVIGQHLGRINVTRGYYDRLKNEDGEDGELFRHLHYVVLDGQPPLDPDDTQQVMDETQRTELKKQVGEGILPKFGFALRSVRMIAWESHPDSVALDQAIRSVEVNTREAEAARRRAEGERDALQMRAEGDAAIYRRPVEELVLLGVTPDVAAQVLATDRRTANIGDKNSSVVTYVEGGANTGVMIQTPQPQPPPTSPPSSPPPPPPPSTP